MMKCCFYFLFISIIVISAEYHDERFYVLKGHYQDEQVLPPSLFHNPAIVQPLQDARTNKQKVNQRVEQEQNVKLVGADIHTEIEMPVHIKIVTITEDEANAIIAKKNS